MPASRRTRSSARLWMPATLRSRRDRAPLSYLVVDEIESSFVGLSVSPWPTIDEVGRLRFGSERPRSVGAARADLERFLARHRQPRAGSRRPVRIGDAYAVVVKEPIPAGELADPASWMQPPVYDVSADARDAAKAAFYSAVAPLLDPKRDKEIVGLAAPKRKA